MLDLLYRQPRGVQLCASSQNIVTMFINMNRQKQVGTMKITESGNTVSNFTIVLLLLHRSSFKTVLQNDIYILVH